MVFLLPLQSVHAASPTVTVSTETSGVLTAVTSETVGTSVVITGSGFSAGATVTIVTTVGTTTVPWLTSNSLYGTCATTNGGVGSSSSHGSVDSLVVSGCLTTTAAGTFQTTVAVPALPGGVQTISVSDGTLTGVATLTIQAHISVSYTGNNFGFPEETIAPTISATGFGAGESVTFATPMWANSAPSCASITGNSVGTFGECSTGALSTTVADITGGAKTITGTGATSGLTAPTTYTVYPWAAFYNTISSLTTFSFLGTAPTSILIEAHGLPAGTIAANSITVGGIATSHTSMTVGANGAFGGQGGQLTVTPLAQVPYGLATVVMDGTTFSYAAGNIALGAGTWGGALVSSVASSATAVVNTDAANYKPGTGFTASTTSPAPAQNQIGFFGYGFTPTGDGAVTLATPTGVSSLTITFNTGNNGGTANKCNTTVDTCDLNGAVFATGILGNTAWSTNAAPGTAASYSPTLAQTGNSVTNFISPSFGITPYISTATGGVAATTVDFTSSEAVTVFGFGSQDVVTVTIGGSSLVTGATGYGTCTLTISSVGTCSTVSGQVPDLAGGHQTLVATGSISGAAPSTTVTYDPNVAFNGGTALSVNTGGAGTLTSLRTAAAYGVHGLLANTAYNIVWNAITGGTVLTSFTSTGTGGIPVPGQQVTIPSDSSGCHLLDIQPVTGGSAIYGSTAVKDVASTSATACSSSTYTGYGDLAFFNVALLSASPSVAIFGQSEALSGSGLAAGTTYVVALGTGAGTVSKNAPGLKTFVATSAGSVPANTNINLGDNGTRLETGTVGYLSVQSAANFGTTTTSNAYAQFVLAASASLNMSSAPAGHNVILSAHGLHEAGEQGCSHCSDPGSTYTIVFNYVQSALSTTSYTGTPVGIISPNSVGAGSATFTIPANVAAGSYTIQLVTNGGAAASSCGSGGSSSCGGAPAGTAVLDTPGTLTVGSVSSTTCNTTNCMTVSGTPTETTQGAYKGVQSTFTNTSNAPVTAFVYAVVHNALGQTVDISTATITAPAGGSATAFNALFGLPSGTYSVTLFITSSSGTAISGTSTVTVTI